MCNKLFYPAIFHKAEEGGFWISFPDFPECLTEGEDREQAYEMAIEALGLTITDKLHNKEELPMPSATENIISDSNCYVDIIEFDMHAYNKKHNSKATQNPK